MLPRLQKPRRHYNQSYDASFQVQTRQSYELPSLNNRNLSISTMNSPRSPHRVHQFTHSFNKQYQKRDFGLGTVDNDPKRHSRHIDDLRITRSQMQFNFQSRKAKYRLICEIYDRFGISITQEQAIEMTLEDVKALRAQIQETATLNELATKIQTAWRRYRLKKKEEQTTIRMNAAATYIQRFWKNQYQFAIAWDAMRRKIRNSITTVQRIYRGYREREDYAVIKGERNMQSNFDFFVQQSDMIREKSASIIQRWYRRLKLLAREKDMRQKKARALRNQRNRNRGVPGMNRRTTVSPPKPSPPKMVKTVSTPVSSPNKAVVNIVPTPTAEEKAAKEVAKSESCPVPETTTQEQPSETEEQPSTSFVTQASEEPVENELDKLPVRDDLPSCSEKEEEEENDEDGQSRPSLQQTMSMEQTQSVEPEQPADEDNESQGDDD